MTTEYTSTLTLACPENRRLDGNHFACLMGEAPEDIDTFLPVSYVNAKGKRYSVIHTVVKPLVFDPLSTGKLPPTPANRGSIVNRVRAEAAFASVNTPNGLLLAIDVDFETQLVEWGLTRLPETEYPAY